MLACYGSILEYFTGEPHSWDKLDELTGFKENKAAWTISAIIKMNEMGFHIKMVEPFDYQRYYEIGEPYLSEVFTDSQLDWQLKNSNIKEMKNYIPRFVDLNLNICRTPTLADIDEMLADRMLVTVTLNSRELNEKPGYNSHMILIIGKNNDTYIAHDPGLPPIPRRAISSELLWRAMGAGREAADVTGFRLS